PVADFGRGKHIPEGRNLAMGSKTQSIDGRAAGPFQRDAVFRGRAERFGYDLLCQVVEFAETFAFRDGKPAAAPQIFQRSLGRVPFPPAAATARLAASCFAG